MKALQNAQLELSLINLGDQKFIHSDVWYPKTDNILVDKDNVTFILKSELNPNGCTLNEMLRFMTWIFDSLYEDTKNYEDLYTKKFLWNIIDMQISKSKRLLEESKEDKEKLIREIKKMQELIDLEKI